jgi:hypothetical protein
MSALYPSSARSLQHFSPPHSFLPYFYVLMHNDDLMILSNMTLHCVILLRERERANAEVIHAIKPALDGGPFSLALTLLV